MSKLKSTNHFLFLFYSQFLVHKFVYPRIKINYVYFVIQDIT